MVTLIRAKGLCLQLKSLLLVTDETHPDKHISPLKPHLADQAAGRRQLN